MRRLGTPSDPTPRKVLGLEGRKILYSILDTFSEREAGVIALRYGLIDGQPRALDVVARIYGISREAVRQIEQRVMLKMRRQPERINVLEVWDGGLLVDVVDTPSYASSMAAAVQITWCSQCHKVPLTIRDELSKGGRPRKYCSARCRQAAYRTRRSGI